MGFASAWLQQRAIFPEFIKQNPDEHTGIIVIVPAYNETRITELLDSLAACRKPDCRTEVIIVVNAPPDAPEEHIRNNKMTVSEIESWKKRNNCFFRLFCINPVSDLPGWGVGLARKTGMDEALRRFDAIDRPGGVILNLDADCTVGRDYFDAVCHELFRRKDRTACSIRFEHPLEGEKFPESVYRSIAMYELHLRYYYQGLLFSGFPYVYHTMGSAMAVKAIAYMKAGGMNRRQAGEDFYFIQKLVASGGYFSLNSTAVYPSPRTSLRVPFGTGATMDKLSGSDNQGFLTYDLSAFRELKLFFSSVDSLYNCDYPELPSLYAGLPYGIRSFIPGEEWMEKAGEIKNNTSGLTSFRKRFFGWFNMFRIVKYLNFAHRDYLSKRPVIAAAAELLDERGIVYESKEAAHLLAVYRKLELRPTNPSAFGISP